jgi:ketosteroid isomerase-like protein
MDKQEIRTFVREWIGLWNARDLDGVLAHFADHVTFTSPTAAQLVDGSDGVVRGKAALRAYWSYALSRNTDLRFELVDIYVGVDTVVINYRNQHGVLVNEVLIFDGPLVVQGHATHIDAQESGDQRRSPR